MKENKKKYSEDEDDYMSETRVLERMTDRDYSEEEKRASLHEAEDDPSEDTGYMSETRVLERMTDNPQKEDEGRNDSYYRKASVKKKANPAVKEARSFLIDLVVCILAVLLITNFVVRPVQVEGNSMYPTLHDNSEGFSDLLGYHVGGIRRFDIVIVYLSEKNEYLVKRVVGLPGETVSYQDGSLYINGKKTDEPFLDQSYIEKTESSEGIFMNDVQPVTLGEDEYFCLGDNRPHSTDSRFYGPFKKDQIVSRGVFIFWPLSQIGVHTW